MTHRAPPTRSSVTAAARSRPRRAASCSRSSRRIPSAKRRSWSARRRAASSRSPASRCTTASSRMRASGPSVEPPPESGFELRPEFRPELPVEPRPAPRADPECREPGSTARARRRGMLGFDARSTSGISPERKAATGAGTGAPRDDLGVITGGGTALTLARSPASTERVVAAESGDEPARPAPVTKPITKAPATADPASTPPQPGRTKVAGATTGPEPSPTRAATRTQVRRACRGEGRPARRAAVTASRGSATAWASLRRARRSREYTVFSLVPSTSAASDAVSPCSSMRAKASRWRGSIVCRHRTTRRRAARSSSRDSASQGRSGVEPPSRCSRARRRASARRWV